MQDVFQKFDLNNGKFIVTFNWIPLIIGFIWYLLKGMWAKALIILILVIFSGGILAVPSWIYCAIAGNYDYYLLKVKGKQLW